MTDIAINPSKVSAGTGAFTRRGVAGESIVAGDVVEFENNETGNWLKAELKAVLETSPRRPHHDIGFAINAAEPGQSFFIQTTGQINLGSVLKLGDRYYLGDEPGRIYADDEGADDGNRILIGVAESKSVLSIIVQRETRAAVN